MADPEQPSAAGQSYRLHPALFGYVAGDEQVLLETSPTESPLAVTDNRLLEALRVLPTRFTEGDAKSRWDAAAPAYGIAHELWAFAVAEQLIVAAQPERGGRREAFLHEVTRSYPFLDMALPDSALIDNRRMQEYERAHTAPPVFHSVDAVRHMPLPGLETAVAAAQSPGCELTMHDLAVILGGSVGLRRHVPRTWGTSTNRPLLQVELVFKPVPSGGSRHPTEVFVLIPETHANAGVHHYNVENHRLDALDITYPELRAHLELPREWSVGAVVVYASFVERAMWRYRDPRSFRAVIFDVGHISQQVAELSEWLGWQSTEIDAFDQAALAQLLCSGSCVAVLGMSVIGQRMASG
ncbi:MAG TPA: SagB/ThcOx family dehydrogenase [Jatrophihabitans sp.]|jgi:SagB-type dehydrogenase family enzyme|uniref:SagB/ThcOx family dehydrogenase n=1 Tax=Jatrophihabitans sp. TaxID=1932789 RepID=UPI002F256799